MRIHNFRAGFATNSSSSHSVVLLPAFMIGSVKDLDVDGDNYGWDYFRLASEEQKLRYLAAQFFINYHDDKSAVADFLEKIEQEVAGYSAEYAEAMLDTRDYYENDLPLPTIDHQSVMGLPKKYNPNLASSLINYFKSPRVVVLGGNDNDGDDSSIRPRHAEDDQVFNSIRDMGHQNFVMRQDDKFITLFSRSAGTKVRFSFDIDSQDVAAYTKASAPELVDVKITNWCKKGCAYCYQSSTTDGVHASMPRIHEIAKMLAEMEVFEVAIGGGEPTAHPDFPTILKTFHDAGIVPNFTTYSDQWLDNEEIVEAVTQYAGAVGVSCLSAKDLDLVERIQNLFRGNRWGGHKVMAQHVVGSVPMNVTAEFLDTAKEKFLSVLLLGYKNVGFGKSYTRHDDQTLETYLKLAMTKDGWLSLSVDTALVDQHPGLPAALGAPTALVSSPEGKFSCYIDAVDGLMAASSYVEKNTMDDLVLDKTAFLEKFARY